MGIKSILQALLGVHFKIKTEIFIAATVDDFN